jgi:hypothetical protein
MEMPVSSLRDFVKKYFPDIEIEKKIKKEELMRIIEGKFVEKSDQPLQRTPRKKATPAKQQVTEENAIEYRFVFDAFVYISRFFFIAKSI